MDAFTSFQKFINHFRESAKETQKPILCSVNIFHFVSSLKNVEIWMYFICKLGCQLSILRCSVLFWCFFSITSNTNVIFLFHLSLSFWFIHIIFSRYFLFVLSLHFVVVIVFVDFLWFATPPCWCCFISFSIYLYITFSFQLYFVLL